MSLRRATLSRLPHRHPDLAAFAPVYLALAVLPPFGEIAGPIGWQARNAVPRGLPGQYVVGRGWFWIAVATIAVGVAYAFLRGDGIRADSPDRRQLDAVAVAVLVPAGIFTALLIGIDVVLGASLADAASIAYVPATPTVLARTAVAGLLIGLGYAVLFQGGVQDALRRQYGPAVAVSAVTVLAGLYHWLLDPTLATHRWTPTVFVVLALVVATSYTTVLLARIADEPSLAAALTPHRIAAFALAAVLGVGLGIDVLNGVTTVAELLLAAAWIAVVGVAAWAYEETRSVLVPALTVAVFQITVMLAPNAELALGLATLPSAG